MEAIVNIVVGLFFLIMGGTLLFTFLALGPAFEVPEEQYILAFCLAVGIALVIVGGRALWENRTQRNRDVVSQS